MVEDFEILMESPELSINEYSNKVRNQIDILRDELINKIQDASEKMMKQVDEYEKECSENTNKIKSEFRVRYFSEIKQDLESRKSATDSLVINEQIWKTSAAKGNELCHVIKKESVALKDQLFLGEKKKKHFDIKYSNVFDAFSSHIGFNRYVYIINNIIFFLKNNTFFCYSKKESPIQCKECLC
jgi:hypothetical protein